MCSALGRSSLGTSKQSPPWGEAAWGHKHGPQFGEEQIGDSKISPSLERSSLGTSVWVHLQEEAVWGLQNGPHSGDKQLGDPKMGPALRRNSSGTPKDGLSSRTASCWLPLQDCNPLWDIPATPKKKQNKTSRHRQVAPHFFSKALLEGLRVARFWNSTLSPASPSSP